MRTAIHYVLPVSLYEELVSNAAFGRVFVVPFFATLKTDFRALTFVGLSVLSSNWTSFAILGCTFVNPVEDAEKTRREKQRAGEYYDKVIREHEHKEQRLPTVHASSLSVQKIAVLGTTFFAQERAKAGTFERMENEKNPLASEILRCLTMRKRWPRTCLFGFSLRAWIRNTNWGGMKAAVLLALSLVVYFFTAGARNVEEEIATHYPQVPPDQRQYFANLLKLSFTRWNNTQTTINVQDFDCPTYPPQEPPPTSVNRLRPADISFVCSRNVHANLKL